MPCRAMHEVTRPAPEQSEARARSSADKTEGPNACGGVVASLALFWAFVGEGFWGACGMHRGIAVDCRLPPGVLAVR